MNNFDKLMNWNQLPKIYEKSTSAFWDDEHISKGMLEAHLNENWDAATRKPEFVNASVDWINSLCESKQIKNLLDLGCGPGIYAEKFYQKGFNVTGVDFSKRSIEYAKQKAIETGSTIKYTCNDYLSINYHEEFDIVTLIYCDYGVLSTDERKTLLKKIYEGLKPGGKLVFDVFTERFYDGKKDTQEWAISPNGSFYSANPHLSLEREVSYGNNVRLHEIFVISEDFNTNVYRIWDTTFSKKSITKELEEAGFIVDGIFGDVKGKPYEDTSEMLGVVAKK